MRQTRINEIDDCFNAVATYNADAFLCETDETMEEVADFITRSDDERILTKEDGYEYEDATERLGFATDNRPEKIHVFTADGETLYVTFDNEY